jgi:hypothetical protein
MLESIVLCSSPKFRMLLRFLFSKFPFFPLLFNLFGVCFFFFLGGGVGGGVGFRMCFLLLFHIMMYHNWFFPFSLQQEWNHTMTMV